MPEAGVREIRYAFDDELICSVKKNQAAEFISYPFSHPAIVVGKGSVLAREVNVFQAVRDNIPVYRRRGGGCAVYLDPGSLIVSAAFPAPGIAGIRSLFDSCTQWLMDGLKQTGVPGITMDGISDLVINNRKIGGTCFYRSKGFAYYSAGILVSVDPDLMAAYLFHPPREPEYRQKREHADFVTSLEAHMAGITADALCTQIKQKLNAHDLDECLFNR